MKYFGGMKTTGTDITITENTFLIQGYAEGMGGIVNKFQIIFFSHCFQSFYLARVSEYMRNQYGLGAIGYLGAAEAISNTMAENSLKLISLKGLLEKQIVLATPPNLTDGGIRVMALMDDLL